MLLKKISISCSALLAAFAFTTSLSAKAMDASASSDDVGLSSDAISIKERVFAKLHSTDLAEISQSQIAVTKSKNAKVVMEAQQMIRDHSDGERELVAFAARTRTPVRDFVPMTPAEIADKRTDEAVMNELIKVQGALFDTTFVSANIEAHMKVYNWLNEKLPMLSAEDRTFVMNQMTVIHNHYEMLVQIQKELNH